jgi:hypothetical protein
MTILSGKYLKSIFRSPFFLPLIFTLALAAFIPTNFHRYKLHIERVTSEANMIRYDDLDLDGESERLVFMDNTNASGLLITNNSGFIDQWNVRGSFEFHYKTTLYLSGDYDSDGIKEVYFFSLSGDSILLYSIPDFRKPSFGIRDRLIAITGPGIKRPDPWIVDAFMDDLDHDGKKEVIFGISSGFSLFPRSVYAYFPGCDSLVKSPKSCAGFNRLLQADIDGDGKTEIIPVEGASANCDTTMTGYNDNSCWLMILDNHLNFKYKPREYPGRYSVLTPLFYNDGQNSFFGAYHFVREPGKKSGLFILDKKGNEVKTIDIEDGTSDAFMTNDRSGGLEIIVGQKDNGFEVFDRDLIIKKWVDRQQSVRYLKKMDIDLDGQEEIITASFYRNLFSAARAGLRYPASVAMDLSHGLPDYISMVLRKEGMSYIYVHAGSNDYYLTYIKNPFYLVDFAIFPAIYLGLLLFAFIIQKNQKIKLLERYNSEKKITELQMNLIRNQLDPHFTLNAMNSIIYSLNNNSPEATTENLRAFANLYRNLLLSATDIRTTIDEEVEFCNNYLSLEKLRMSEKLDYTISVSPDVNRKAYVPKMMLQVFAENAVKHGIFNLESAGNLAIKIYTDNLNLRVEIKDTGIGRKAAGELTKSSTGKGLQLMEEFFYLYRKYYNEDISYQIIDLQNMNGNPSGTLVSIVLKNYESQKRS